MAKSLSRNNLLSSAECKKKTLLFPMSEIWWMTLTVLTVHGVGRISIATMCWKYKTFIVEEFFFVRSWFKWESWTFWKLFCLVNKYTSVLPQILLDLGGSNTARSLLVYLFYQLMAWQIQEKKLNESFMDYLKSPETYAEQF